MFKAVDSVAKARDQFKRRRKGATSERDRAFSQNLSEVSVHTRFGAARLMSAVAIPNWRMSEHEWNAWLTQTIITFAGAAIHTSIKSSKLSPARHVVSDGCGLWVH